MALTPHVEDKNRKDVLDHIKKLEKEDTAESADQLKREFNMGEKEQIIKVNQSQVDAVNKNKN